MMKFIRIRNAKVMLLFMSTVIAAGTIALGSTNPALAALTISAHRILFSRPVRCLSRLRPSTRSRTKIFSPRSRLAWRSSKTKSWPSPTIPRLPPLRTPSSPWRRAASCSARASAVFSGVTGANTNDTLQKVKTIEAPKLAAHQDFIFLNTKLFARVAAHLQATRHAQA